MGKLGTVDLLPPGGVGEVNDGANVGTAGVGIYKGKSGVILQFKKLNPASAKVTITDDIANSKIDIDVAEAEFNLANIGGELDLTTQVTGTLPLGSGGTGGTDAATARTSLGLGSAAVENTSAFDPAGSAAAALVSANSYSDGLASNYDPAGSAAAVAADLSTHEGLANPHSGSAASDANSDITSLSGLTTPLTIGQGGTGQTTQTAAFDALAPTTTAGDLIVYGVSDNVRLPIGSDGEVIVADSGQAAGMKWDNLTINGATEFHLNNAASGDIGGYLQLTVAVYTGGPDTKTGAGLGDGDTTIEEWATEANIPNVTSIPSGIWTVHIHATKSAGTKGATIKAEIYKRASGGAETLLGTTEDSELLAGVSASIDVHAAIGDQVVLATDRLVVKVIATVTGAGTAPTVDLTIGGTTSSHLSLPSVGLVGTLAVAKGGTGATTPSGARTNLDAQEDLSGATISSATVATDDKVLVQDTNDSDNLKTVTAQSIANLAVRYINLRVVEAATDCEVGATVGGDFVVPFTGTILQSDALPHEFVAYNDTAGVTGTMVVDIHLNGTTIMDINKLDIETAEKTTATATTKPDLTTTAVTAGDIITIDVDAIRTTAAKGLTVRIPILIT